MRRLALATALLLLVPPACAARMDAPDDVPRDALDPGAAAALAAELSRTAAPLGPGRGRGDGGSADEGERAQLLLGPAGEAGLLRLAGVELRVAGVALPRGALLLLAGSDLVLPLRARDAAAPARLAPEPAPREPVLARAPMPEPAAHAPAPRPAARPGEPEQPSAEAAAPPAPPSPWPERATLAGAALMLLLVPLALYHRLRGANLLAHEARGRLLALARERPGLTPTEAARELGLDRSTIRYHLRRLEKEGHLASASGSRGVRYFLPGTFAPEARERALAELDSAEVLDAVRAAPGASKSALARRLAIARASVHWHLSRLEQAGLVRCVRAGRAVKVFPRQETFS